MQNLKNAVCLLKEPGRGAEESLVLTNPVSGGGCFTFKADFPSLVLQLSTMMCG